MHDFKFYGSATVGSKGQIVIPAEVREEYDIKEGDKLVVLKAPFHQGVMVLKGDFFEKHLNEMQSHINDFKDNKGE